VQEVVKKDGVAGLFVRGLGTKIITNGMQVRARPTHQAAAGAYWWWWESRRRRPG
jgi:hypothetical protein